MVCGVLKKLNFQFIYIQIITIFITVLTYAQSPIIDIDTWNGDGQTNAYYKDVNNYFNPFVGTWLYTNGNTSLKIVLHKEVMGYTGKFYTDDIIGEYQKITLLRFLHDNTNRNIYLYKTIA